MDENHFKRMQTLKTCYDVWIDENMDRLSSFGQNEVNQFAHIYRENEEEAVPNFREETVKEFQDLCQAIKQDYQDGGAIDG